MAGEWGKGHWPYELPWFRFSLRERGLQQWEETQHWLPAPLFALLWSGAAVSLQRSSRVFGGQSLFCSPWLSQVVYKLLQKPYTAVCHVAGGNDNCHGAQSWNWLKLTIIYSLGLPLEIASLQQTPEFQIFLSHRFWQCSCFLDGETSSLPSSSEPLLLLPIKIYLFI